MILQVFKSVGSTLSIADAYTALISVYSNQIYPTKKAAGSLGGAVNGGTIILKNGCYVLVPRLVDIDKGTKLSLGRNFYHMVKRGELDGVKPAGKNSSNVQLYVREEV